ncbi:hypothetical protein [Streptomyces sp. NPDC056817]|uniref:hypothetical protein n=1 Tax=Streptomyces sp. NPDC056817 TaxID=3345950 RepID=UPI0036B3C16A
MPETMTKAEAEKLPVFEECAEPEIGTFYLWRDWTDPELTFFVRPTAADELGTIAEVFVIRDGVVSFVAGEIFARENGRLRLIED